ncbi:sulfur carrier protein ThiS adenylyltransferase [Desulforamulus putei DSM 12395]|uniref:Sulfur carrier protein ThiS adenylyltransferase n=1 Tax=Desulforamulus putei DSM 12395 TaxID=1121429 RepID=A0A1M4Z311_9FIRM|nr:sulfur carrier protein ThiS adenylyltransferase ThiF [Desulforamulus putei]SHF12431.1 sulfur carrier protein ThiS adenylyltransferase [Desulforamulus putei DSM 12395]
MNEFVKALSMIFGPEDLAKIQRVRVGIAGAGGLGSNCAQFLARSGFQNFKIVDFDRVEYSNLNRQFFFYHQVGEAKVEALKRNLLQINPDIKLDVLQVQIHPDNIGSLFEDCHAVVEALDRPEYKKLVVESYLPSGKLLVAASGLAGWGNTDQIKVHRVKEHFFLVGDLVSEVQPHCPPVAPGVVITAAKQADVVLRYFLGKCGVKNIDS